MLRAVLSDHRWHALRRLSTLHYGPKTNYDVGADPTICDWSRFDAPETATRPARRRLRGCAELYREYLEFSGFHVETATNGREAIDQALALMPTSS
jgi:hypothetical protein